MVVLRLWGVTKYLFFPFRRFPDIFLTSFCISSISETVKVYEAWSLKGEKNWAGHLLLMDGINSHTTLKKPHSSEMFMSHFEDYSRAKFWCNYLEYMMWSMQLNAECSYQISICYIRDKTNENLDWSGRSQELQELKCLLAISPTLNTRIQTSVIYGY
jgi:hypothetical protein